MEVVVGVLAVGVSVAAFVAVQERRRERTRVAWRAVARRWGFGVAQVDERGVLTAIRGPLGIRVKALRRGPLRRRWGTRLVVAGLSDELVVGSVRRLSLVDRLAGTRLPTGDAAFDAAVFVTGRPAVVRAVLDHETRRLARALFAGVLPATDAEDAVAMPLAIDVSRKELRAEIAGDWRSGDPLLARGVRAVCALALRLRTFSVEKDLGAVARADPEPAVRRFALSTLVTEAPAHSAALRAARHACQDPDPLIRLQGALALGGRGHETLLALVNERCLDDEGSEEALRALGDAAPVEAAARILAHALSSGQHRTARAAVACLGRAGGAAEPSLLAALESPADDVVGEAARLLGEAGTVRAVPRLRDMEERGGTVRRAAREAIAAIQSRLSGASAGQVALADGDAGRLSVSEDGDGRVSLDVRRDGRR
jgi:hypothetical protein